ncbi:MAG: hypothetical protein WC623_07780 [Pedobacter sp.]|uniref:hypothetical protein n=1 Tax=Pedobacter sp. TaxID=1411316 RepID=UPI003567DCC8
MEKLNKNLVYINIPKTLNFTEEFGTLSSKKQDIIKFIISEFNYRTKKNGAARHNRNTMLKFFSISPNLYNELLKLLIEKDLIEKTETSSFGVVRKNNGYTLLETFECNDEESIQHIYTLTDDNCPEFIKRWVADDFQILKESKYIPVTETKDFKPKTKNQLHQQVIELQSFILQQREEIECLKGELSNVNTSIQSPIVEPVISRKEVVTEPVNNDEDDNLFIQKIGNKTYYYANYPIIKNIANDEDDEGVIINKLQAARDDDGQSIVYKGKAIYFNKTIVANEIVIELVA